MDYGRINLGPPPDGPPPISGGWADPGPPSGGCPIRALPILVGIPDREIPYVVRVRWGYTDRATATPVQVLETGDVRVQRGTAQWISPRTYR